MIRLTLPPQSVPFDEGRARFILLLVYPARLVFLWPVVMPGWHLIRLMLMKTFRPPGVPPRRLRDIQVAGKLSL